MGIGGFSLLAASWPVMAGPFTREDFALMSSVNIAAAFFASQALLPAMRAQGGGRIIHMASQLGSVAAEENALYGLTKAALIHLAKNMAFELARENIQVNAISPGPIATDFLMQSWANQPGKIATMTSRVPAGRFETPGLEPDVVRAPGEARHLGLQRRAVPARVCVRVRVCA